MGIYVIEASEYVGEDYYGADEYKWVLDPDFGYFTDLESVEDLIAKVNAPNMAAYEASEVRRRNEYDRYVQQYEDAVKAVEVLEEMGLPTRVVSVPFKPRPYVPATPPEANGNFRYTEINPADGQ